MLGNSCSLRARIGSRLNTELGSIFIQTLKERQKDRVNQALLPRSPSGVLLFLSQGGRRAPALACSEQLGRVGTLMEEATISSEVSKHLSSKRGRHEEDLLTGPEVCVE